MTSHIAKAAVEELKKFLIHDSVDEMKRRLDKLFMVVILRTLHSDFDHVLDQILAGEQVPSMDSLVTRLLCVPTLVRGENSVVATETSVAPVETSAMVASRGRGSRGNRGGRSSRGGRPQCTYCKKLGHTQEKCYVLHGYPNNVAHVSKSEKSESKFSDEKYQDYLRLKSISQAQASSWPSVSIACISQYVEGQNPWIIDSSASDHISSNKSLFSSIFPPKFPHLVTFSIWVQSCLSRNGQVPFSFSLKLNSILYIPNCPYNLISLSQLTRSLNCPVTFDVDSFVI